MKPDDGDVTIVTSRRVLPENPPEWWDWRALNVEWEVAYFTLVEHVEALNGTPLSDVETVFCKPAARLGTFMDLMMLVDFP